MLSAVQAADDAGTPMDNEMLAKALGWELADIARSLQAAKSQSLVWGWREARLPGPWFTTLELTVQGRRFLRSYRQATADSSLDT